MGRGKAEGTSLRYAQRWQAELQTWDTRRLWGGDPVPWPWGPQLTKGCSSSTSWWWRYLRTPRLWLSKGQMWVLVAGQTRRWQVLRTLDKMWRQMRRRCMVSTGIMRAMRNERARGGPSPLGREVYPSKETECPWITCFFLRSVWVHASFKTPFPQHNMLYCTVYIVCIIFKISIAYFKTKSQARHCGGGWKV